MADPQSDTTATAKSNHHDPTFPRFTVAQRIEHWVFITSFIILAITGLVQKFPLSPLSNWIVNNLLGGIDNTRLIHHTAAVIMLLCVVYHIGAVGYRVFVIRKSMTMLPTIYDARSSIDAIAYYLGFRKSAPQQGRYTFEEKIEYYAVVWGTVIMIITGAIMWNPITWTQYLPGQVVPAAKYAHGAEAILAVLSILIWHFYGVLVKTLNKSMFTGKLSEEQMEDEHPLELADVKAGFAQQPINSQEKKRRSLIFWPIYGVIAFAGLAWIFYFTTHETTAITTLREPIETVEVFVPLTPTPFPTPRPSATSAPVQALTWEAGIGDLFNTKCGTCHGSSSRFGDLDLSSYAGITAGSKSGQVVNPGNPDGSLLIQVQAAGGHAGQFSPEELEIIKEWIAAAAPEN